jgi:hypothetical protein
MTYLGKPSGLAITFPVSNNLLLSTNIVLLITDYYYYSYAHSLLFKYLSAYVENKAYVSSETSQSLLTRCTVGANSLKRTKKGSDM